MGMVTWSKDDEQLLKDHYHELGPDEIGRRLNRPRTQVWGKARSMGLLKCRGVPGDRVKEVIKLRKQGLTLKEVAEKLGLKIGQVERAERIGQGGWVCKHCDRHVKRLIGRGLCTSCYQNKDVRALYPARGGEGQRKVRFATEAPPQKSRQPAGPTEEELDALIAERMKNLPDWWDAETKAEAARRKRGIIDG